MIFPDAGKSALPKLVRGENPIPIGGWGWSLSDYEVRYVRKFGVRPLRDPLLTADRESEERLEREAEALLSNRFRWRPPTEIRTRSLVIFLTPLVLVGMYFSYLAISTYLASVDLNNQAIEKEARIHE